MAGWALHSQLLPSKDTEHKEHARKEGKTDTLVLSEQPHCVSQNSAQKTLSYSKSARSLPWVSQAPSLPAPPASLLLLDLQATPVTDSATGRLGR